VIGFFGDVRVRVLEVGELRGLDPTLKSFFNANTPDALATAARDAAQERSGED
jgi:hypothetical protein